MVVFTREIPPNLLELSHMYDAIRPAGREERKEVNSKMTFAELRELFASLRNEEGQTMAEYAVVLSVITLLVVGAFTALSGGISGAVDAVTGILS
jgi:Flp pilus assembly pilin Flp